MRRLMSEKETEVRIIDTASMAMPGKDAANLIVMQGLLHRISNVCRKLGVTFILVHHTHAGCDPPRPSLETFLVPGNKAFASQWTWCRVARQ